MGAPTSPNNEKTGSPLFKVFLTVSLLLLLPAVIYSISPKGPVKKGDTVFSNGKYHVPFFHHNGQPKQQEKTCVLEPGTPLIVIERPTDQSNGSFSARVQGTTQSENPFCPPQAEIRITTLQINQGRKLWKEFQQKLSAYW